LLVILCFHANGMIPLNTAQHDVQESFVSKEVEQLS